jgi:hypothetical protein
MRDSLARRGDAWLFLAVGLCFLVAGARTGDLFSVVLGVLSLINAAIRFLGVHDRARERRQERLEARYAGRRIPPRPDEVPRWFSPDNPPGWYLDPASNEPAYWSELGWRTPVST